jgi:hypothetical protein
MVSSFRNFNSRRLFLTLSCLHKTFVTFIFSCLIAGLLQGSLKEVEALQEVKAELEGKTTLLYTRLLEDLTSQVSDAGKSEAGGGPAGSEG